MPSLPTSFPERHRTSGTEGFTLIELIVAIVILGVLASLGVSAYREVQHRSRVEMLDQSAAGTVREAEALAAMAQSGHVPGHLDEGTQHDGTITVQGYPASGRVQARGWDLCREVTVASDGTRTEPGDCAPVGTIVLTGMVVQPDGSTEVTWEPDPQADAYEVCQVGQGCTTTSSTSTTVPTSDPVTVTGLRSDGSPTSSTSTTQTGGSSAPPAVDDDGGTWGISTSGSDVLLAWTGVGSAVERYEVERCDVPPPAGAGVVSCDPTGPAVATVAEDGSADYQHTDTDPAAGAHRVVCYRVTGYSGTSGASSNAACVTVNEQPATPPHLANVSATPAGGAWAITWDVQEEDGSPAPDGVATVEVCDSTGACTNAQAGSGEGVVWEPGTVTLTLTDNNTGDVWDTATTEAVASAPPHLANVSATPAGGAWAITWDVQEEDGSPAPDGVATVEVCDSTGWCTNAQAGYGEAVVWEPGTVTLTLTDNNTGDVWDTATTEAVAP